MQLLEHAPGQTQATATKHLKCLLVNELQKEERKALPITGFGSVPIRNDNVVPLLVTSSSSTLYSASSIVGQVPNREEAAGALLQSGHEPPANIHHGFLPLQRPGFPRHAPGAPYPALHLDARGLGTDRSGPHPRTV